MLRPKKNSFREFDNEKKFLPLKNFPPSPNLVPRVSHLPAQAREERPWVSPLSLGREDERPWERG